MSIPWTGSRKLEFRYKSGVAPRAVQSFTPLLPARKPRVSAGSVSGQIIAELCTRCWIEAIARKSSGVRPELESWRAAMTDRLLTSDLNGLTFEVGYSCALGTRS